MGEVMFRECVEVPAINGMEGPSATCIQFFVHLDFPSSMGQWHLGVIERFIEVGIGRDCVCGVGLLL